MVRTFSLSIVPLAALRALVGRDAYHEHTYCHVCQLAAHIAWLDSKLSLSDRHMRTPDEISSGNNETMRQSALLTAWLIKKCCRY